MSPDLATAATTHDFPPAFARFPRLLRLVHLLMAATTLRVWYVRRAVRRLLRNRRVPFVLLDAGCGHGDYLLPAAARHPSSHFVGVDKIESNVAVCSAYARARGLRNTSFVAADVARFSPDGPVDVVLCIGVMQLVPDDTALLNRFHGSLRPGGQLLLYEPVFDHRISTALQRRFPAYFGAYDEAQNRQHRYTPADLVALVEGAGFETMDVEFTYGTAGKIYYELYTPLLFALLSARPRGYLVLIPAFALAMPLFWLLMAIDFVLPKTSGNGMLILARTR
jgi:SAM-dependent methyltransferase